MNPDSYLTLTAESTGEYKDRGSKFIAFAYPVESEEAAQDALASVRKLHPKARHHCYAYRLGHDDSNFRANDDGEPSGTAGRPILGQIDSNSLTNVIIIVVRYFGGTKLGTSGLIKAYKESAAEALKLAEIQTRFIEQYFQLKFGYEIMSDVMNAVKKLEVRIIIQEFENDGKLVFAIRKSAVKETMTRLKALIKKVSIEEAETIDKIEGMEIKLLEDEGS